MKKLYFIRHGLSEMNKSGHFAGSIDTPLTDEGRSQAKAAGQTAKPLNIDLIISSPLSRALETAQIIAAQIGYPPEKIIPSDLFIERSWGDLEGTPHIQVGDYDEIPNAEKSIDLIARAKKAFSYLEGLDANTVLVVSHGTFGRALREHITGEPASLNDVGDKTIRLPNSEVIQWI